MVDNAAGGFFVRIKRQLERLTQRVAESIALEHISLVYRIYYALVLVLRPSIPSLSIITRVINTAKHDPVGHVHVPVRDKKRGMMGMLISIRV